MTTQTPQSVTPYNNSGDGKRDQVRKMFDAIAPRYDLLNHLLSLGIDRRWRSAVVRMVGRAGSARLLDVATGTGDMAIAIARHTQATVTGVDLAPEMLRIARTKVERAGLAIPMIEGDAEYLPFDTASFDAVTSAFGVRNFENLAGGIREMSRVLVPDGRIFVLEFSMPRHSLVGASYRLYFHRILPWIGGVISRDRQAYSYLPESVEAFPYGDRFLEILTANGFRDAQSTTLMGGIATIYSATKC